MYPSIRRSVGPFVGPSVRSFVGPSHTSRIAKKWAKFEQNSITSIRIRKVCDLEDDSKTSTQAVSQNASVVRTLFDLFLLPKGKVCFLCRYANIRKNCSCQTTVKSENNFLDNILIKSGLSLQMFLTFFLGKDIYPMSLFLPYLQRFLTTSSFSSTLVSNFFWKERGQLMWNESLT